MNGEPTQRAIADEIARLVDEGASASEIGVQLGISRQRVMRIAKRFRVRLQSRGGTRRIGAKFSGRRFEIIQRLAQDARVSVATMLVRLVAVMIDEGPVVAARRLGRQARPKRPYQRRTQP